MIRYVLIVALVCVVKIGFSQFRIVGYLPTYTTMYSSPSTVPYDKLTHINVSFAEVDANGNVGLSNTNFLDQVVTLAHQNNVKVLMSIGGGATPDGFYPVLLASTTKRNAFINSLLTFTELHDLDGLDIDLEGSDITADYDAFVLALGDSLHEESKEITAALATWSGGNVSSNVLAMYDFINIMAYDHTGPWNPDKPGHHSTFDQAFSDLNYWIKNKDLPASKAVLGLPFYGYEFKTNGTAGSWRYSTIVDRFAGAEFKDEVSNTIYYNGITTIEDKTKLALNKGSGVMIWEISQDSNDPEKSLLNAIYETVKVGVEESENENSFNIYPNPVSDIIYFNTLENIININVYDTYGVFVGAFQEGFNDGINLSDFVAGMYVLEISTSENQFVTRIVVK